MKIDRIRVGKSVEALGLWHKLDIEGVVGENESPETAHTELKEMLDKLLPSVSNNGLPIPYETTNVYSPTPVINKEKERIEIAIDNCTSKHELTLLQNDALKHRLETEYLIKLKSFE